MASFIRSANPKRITHDVQHIPLYVRNEIRRPAHPGPQFTIDKREWDDLNMNERSLIIPWALTLSLKVSVFFAHRAAVSCRMLTELPSQPNTLLSASTGGPDE